MVKLHLPKPKPIQITQEKYNQSLKEQKKLNNERAEILIRLQAAREMGDLSENGAYTAAKSELRDTDRKLRLLDRLIRWGVIIKSTQNDVIDFDSKVTIQNSEKQFNYHLVSGFESDPLKGKLSVYSPIGKSLMGKKAGDLIDVDTPGGMVTYKIIEIR